MTEKLNEAINASASLNRDDQDTLAGFISLVVSEAHHRRDWTSLDLEVLRMIRLVLLVDWDPIGIFEFPGADGEYDSYVAGLYAVLSNDGDADDVFAYLFRIESQQMGTGARGEERRAYASRKIARRYQTLCRLAASAQRLPAESETTQEDK